MQLRGFFFCLQQKSLEDNVSHRRERRLLRDLEKFFLKTAIGKGCYSNAPEKFKRWQRNTINCTLTLYSVGTLKIKTQYLCKRIFQTIALKDGSTYSIALEHSTSFMILNCYGHISSGESPNFLSRGFAFYSHYAALPFPFCSSTRFTITFLSLFPGSSSCVDERCADIPLTDNPPLRKQTLCYSRSHRGRQFFLSIQLASGPCALSCFQRPPDFREKHASLDGTPERRNQSSDTSNIPTNDKRRGIPHHGLCLHEAFQRGPGRPGASHVTQQHRRGYERIHRPQSYFWTLPLNVCRNVYLGFM